MGKKLLKFIRSGLRWLSWGGKYGVVCPLAILALLFIVAFVAEDNSPGTQLASMAESVQQHGFVIVDCAPLAPEGKLSEKTAETALPQPVPVQNCALISTDAAGYAAYIDAQLLKVGKELWLLLALIFTAGAWVCGFTPRNRKITASGTITQGARFTESRPGRGSSSLIRSICQNRRSGAYYYQPSEKNNGGDGEHK